MNSPEIRSYVLRDFRIDIGKRLLLNAEGEILNITPKVFDTLLYLIEHAGQTVEKEDLMAAVWPDTIVEDNNLSQNISILRRVLGDKRSEHRYIVTIPGHGYKFVGEVRKHLDDVSPASQYSDVQGQKQYVDQPPEIVIPIETETADTPPPWKQLRQRTSLRRMIGSTLAILVFILALAFAVGVLWRDEGAKRTSTDGEAGTFTRLTNGFFPLDATISPDGKFFAYHELDGDLYRMWVQQTGQSSRIEIIPASDQVLSYKSFSPDSKFVYYVAAETQRGPHSLFKVPVLGGPATKVLTGINSYVSFSPDGREIAFTRYDEVSRELLLVVRRNDDSGEESVLFRRASESRLSGSPAWSPDGHIIVLGTSVPRESGPASHWCELLAIPAAGGEPTLIPGESFGVCYRIAWRHDGRGLYMVGTKEGDGRSTRRDQVYFISYPDGEAERISYEDSRHQVTSLGVTNDGSVLAVPFNRTSHIWVMDANGDSRTALQITSGTADGRAGIAPLNNGQIAYLARSGESLDIWVVNLDGSDKRQLTSQPSFIEEIRSGGDGRYIVFSSPQDPFNHLYRMKHDGTDLRQLTFGRSFEVDSGVSNDGQWVAYNSTVLEDNVSKLSLWKIPIEGGRPISLNRSDCYSPYFSPDDKLLSCVSSDNLLLLSAEDGSLIRSFETDVQWVLNFGAVWAPDGTALVFIVVERGGLSNLWMLPIDGTEPKQLTNFTGGNIHRFAYSLDQKRLILARGQQINDAILIHHDPND